MGHWFSHQNTWVTALEGTELKALLEDQQAKNMIRATTCIYEP